MKSIDPEFSALVKHVIEQNAEVLKRLAEFDSEEKADVVAETAIVEETVAEETAVAEVKAEDVAAAIEETATEETPAVESLTEEFKSEEVVAETAQEEQPVVEAKAAISFDDLKEFHNLLKEITKQ